MAPEPEPMGVATRPVLWAALGLVSFLAASLALVWWFERPSRQEASFAPPTHFPEPRLQSNPTGELAAFRAEQRAQLEGFAWVDRQRGVARIPVTRAMAAIVARGASAYDPVVPP